MPVIKASRIARAIAWAAAVVILGLSVPSLHHLVIERVYGFTDSAAEKQREEVVFFEVATPYDAVSFHGQNLLYFLRLMRSLSQGKLYSEAYFGENEPGPELLTSVKHGHLKGDHSAHEHWQIAQIPIASLSVLDPYFSLDTLPFLVRDLDDAWLVYELSRAHLERLLAYQGLKLLYTVPWPAVRLFSKKPVTSWPQLSGLTFRVSTSLLFPWVKSMGGVPQRILISGLSPGNFKDPQNAQHDIDVMLASVGTALSTGVWQRFSWVYKTPLFYPKSMVVMNDQVWQSLNSQTAAAVMAATSRAETRGWLRATHLDRSLLESLDRLPIHRISLSEEVLAQMKWQSHQWLRDEIESWGPYGRSFHRDYLAHSKTPGAYE